MELAIWVDTRHPQRDLIFATSKDTLVELEKIVLEVDESKSIIEQVKSHLETKTEI